MLFPDTALLNLIRKWLRAGILEEDGRVVHPQTGTPQVGIVTPVLANLHLHFVLDVWFEKRVPPKQGGQCRLFRYADDFVVAFEYRHEAQAFDQALKARLAQFGLEVAADKTKTLRFGRDGGPYNGRFDFLGFEFYWQPDREGKPRVKRRTATKKWRAGMQRMRDWIRENRHRPLQQTMKSLGARLQGTWNYYGLIGNYRRMQLFYQETNRTLHKWLNRRSQHRSLSHEAVDRLFEGFQVPPPQIVEKKDQKVPCQMELSFCQRLMHPVMGRLACLANARAS